MDLGHVAPGFGASTQPLFRLPLSSQMLKNSRSSVKAQIKDARGVDFLFFFCRWLQAKHLLHPNYQ